MVGAVVLVVVGTVVGFDVDVVGDVVVGVVVISVFPHDANSIAVTITQQTANHKILLFIFLLVFLMSNSFISCVWLYILSLYPSFNRYNLCFVT